MRSCAYCGKELAKGEKCDCRFSATQHASQNSENSYSGWQDSSYRTGYTKKDKKKFRNIFKRKKKPNFKAADFKSSASGVSGFAKNFIKQPISSVANPGILNSIQLVIIVMLTALGLSLSGYVISARFPSIYSLISPIPIYGIKYLLETALFGTIGISICIAVYLGILYFINKFILKSNTRFGEFIARPTAALVILLVFSGIGFLISFFSIYATVMLLLTGIAMWLIATYEGLRAEWNYIPNDRVIYLFALALFVFMTVLFNLLRII